MTYIKADLPERIGLKPEPCSGEIKRRLFITPILFLPGRGRPACGQQSTVNSQLSTEPLFPGGTLSFNSGIFPLERNIFLLSFLRSLGMKQLEAAKGD